MKTQTSLPLALLATSGLVAGLATPAQARHTPATQMIHAPLHLRAPHFQVPTNTRFYKPRRSCGVGTTTDKDGTPHLEWQCTDGQAR